MVVTGEWRLLISVLIVNYNGLSHLEECLESLASQTFKDFEIVMVDNASVDGSLEFVEKCFPEVRCVKSFYNRGFAGGNNHGIAYCKGDYIFFLNNDTRVDAMALEELAKAVSGNPDVPVYASLLLNYYNPDVVDSAGDEIYRWGVPFAFTGYPADNFKVQRDITSACGGAALYEKSLLEQIGAFDNDFFLVFEDVDLGLRARHAGVKIMLLVPSSKVFHKSSASMGGKRSATSFYYAERNLFLLIIKNFPAITLFKVAPLLAFVKIFRAVRAMQLGLFPTFLRANVDCIKLLPAALRKRKQILRESVLQRMDFERRLRKGWIGESRWFGADKSKRS